MAKNNFKKSFWAYLNIHSPKEYTEKYGQKTPSKKYNKSLKNLRAQIGKKVPRIKQLYSKITGKQSSQRIENKFDADY